VTPSAYLGQLGNRSGIAVGPTNTNAANRLGELIGQGIDPAGDDIGKVGIVH
jgi:hypothetical protein